MSGHNLMSHMRSRRILADEYTRTPTATRCPSRYQRRIVITTLTKTDFGTRCARTRTELSDYSGWCQHPR